MRSQQAPLVDLKAFRPRRRGPAPPPALVGWALSWPPRWVWVGAPVGSCR